MEKKPLRPKNVTLKNNAEDKNDEGPDEAPELCQQRISNHSKSEYKDGQFYLAKAKLERKMNQIALTLQSFFVRLKLELCL